jgi:hypothetical protein
MKYLIVLAALALTACGPSDIMSAGTVAVPPPVAVANRTILDEQIGKGAEIFYKGARTAMELAVDAGLIKGGVALKAQMIDGALFEAIGVVRAAYRAGNAKDYADAAEEVKILAGQLTDIIAGARK